MPNGKKWPTILQDLNKGDGVKISFSFQGRKKITGIVSTIKKVANAIFVNIVDLEKTYKTFSKKPFKYALAIYNERTVYLTVDDGGIREVRFKIKKA